MGAPFLLPAVLPPGWSLSHHRSGTQTPSVVQLALLVQKHCQVQEAKSVMVVKSSYFWAVLFLKRIIPLNHLHPFLSSTVEPGYWKCLGALPILSSLSYPVHSCNFLDPFF